MLTRVHAISDPLERADPEYADGLRAAVSAALLHGLAVVERGESRAPAVPATLLAQAQLGGRVGVDLDTILRRYFAGYALFGDFLVEECGHGGVSGADLKPLLRTQAALFDRLLAAVSSEYRRGVESRCETIEQQLAERIERLLAGELVDAPDLGYDFGGHHLAAIAEGDGAEETVRHLAGLLDRNLLLVRRGDAVVWAWLGGSRPIEPEELARLASAARPPAIALAVGEPGRGLAGWRLSHRQARECVAIARRSPGGHVRYADVALVASVLRDDLLAASMRGLYLRPLEDERDGGEAARRTLLAYFAADRNLSSAAAALGVNRNTVTSRLRAVEARIGRPLAGCAAELEIALRYDRFLRSERPVGSGQDARFDAPG